MGVQRIQVGKGLEGTEGGAALPFAPQFDLEGQGGAAGGAAAGDAGARGSARGMKKGPTPVQAPK